MNDPFSLAGEFPTVIEQDWRKLVEAALKGAAFEERLVSKTDDGLRIEPIYARATGARAVAGRRVVPWQVLARMDHPDAKAVNADALHELENGATGLSLIFAGAPEARGFGLGADTADKLDQALSGVALDAVTLRVGTAPFAGRPVSTLLANVVRRRTLDAAALTIDFGLDPLSDMARTGHAPLPWPQLSARAGATAADLEAKGFSQARFLRADGRAVHEAGGSEAQELAFVLAAGVVYLRLLEAAGFALDDARRRISFILAADADEFLTIAKFRALRKLWGRIEQACGLTPLPAFVAAETAWRMMTARDPYVNMLRTTIAVAAAGIGGADAVTVLPFTLALGLPDRFARRVARNTQLVLSEESNLYRVADPAAGSGAIEHLTTGFCNAAWALFQEIEATGGGAAALERGLLQKKIAAVRKARQAAVATRKNAITGVSDYPNLGEAPVNVLDVARVPTTPLPSTFETLPSLRLAEPFEALRD
jgi:methylmalonyl-CoA mutase